MAETSQTQREEQEPPWHAAFPPPLEKHKPQIFPARRALTILSLKIASLLIIDVRRTDYLGGSIRNSLNIPAQGFYWNRGMLYELAYKADIEWVVFTCGSCKKDSRGEKCASWFLEWVRDIVQDSDMQVCVLEGGVKGWVAQGGQFVECMDGFDAGYWRGLGIEVEEKREIEQKGEVETEKEEVEPSLQTGSVQGDASNAAEVKEKVWSWESMMDG